ncbi:hypothetical protein CRD60_04910 [Bifidobacterium aemilianum]|uniref:Major facilitator superfamily (MFS) profile domain-containing protein n=1 Tax=Bifidobacterium aemilianum TaxID=2493120 RepID=A0A366K9K1_9BIFI|nr:MFS transporter [Bifidobacterium aemilianum]RBP97922.1 hypothetical protein CRD60_04910 [Bifidobacterium aemilianum]
MTESITTAAVDPFDDPETSNKMAVRALIFLLITFILGTLCLQGFNLVFQQVGKDVGAVQQASLITALPSIVLGIVCFIYGSLGDFVSLKKLVVGGLAVLFVGSIFGFVANFFFDANLWTVIIARILQTAGEQVAGSVYLVITTKYLKPSLKVVFFGLFTAGYQLSAAIGVFAAGLLSSIAWQYLFLIPAVTIFFMPVLLRCLPSKSGNGEKVDWLGFTIFGLATAFLTLFFSYSKWWLLLVAVVLFAGFAVYINKAQNPFVTPAFFKNIRWIMAICLILVFYFNNYCMSPIFNAICRDVFGITNSATVSMHIVWAFLVAAFFGTTSGAIVDKIGRQTTLIIAACLMIVGFAGSAFVISTGIIALTLMACVFYAGVGLMYSPVVSTVLDTLPKEQSGRGVGMNDLVMNVTGSIGIAIFGGLMSSDALAGGSLVGVTGHQAVYSNLLLIAAAIALLGLVIYLAFRKRIYAEN